MTNQQFRRGPRAGGPTVPPAAIEPEAPPKIAPRAPRNVLAAVLPLVMTAGVIGLVLVSGGGTSAMVMGGMMVVSALGMALQRGIRFGGAGPSLQEERRRYLRHLRAVRTEIRLSAHAQLGAQLWSHPDPRGLPVLSRGPRLWERRPGDSDYLRVRFGIGAQPLTSRLVSPATSGADIDPLSGAWLRGLLSTQSTVLGVPLTTDLTSLPVVHIIGDDPRGLARALLVQACTFHAPGDLVVAIAAGEAQRHEWEWVKWLPHLACPWQTDDLGPVRMVGDRLSDLEGWLGGLLTGRGTFAAGSTVCGAPHVIVVLDQPLPSGSKELLRRQGLAGVTVLEIGPDARSFPAAAAGSRSGLPDSLGPAAGADVLTGAAGVLQLVCEAGRVGVGASATTTWIGAADLVSPQLAGSIARGLAPWRFDLGAAESPAQHTTFADLVGIADPPSVDTNVAWRERVPAERLRAVLGTAPDGAPVVLDLKEAAQGGAGPHGLLIGATGSGKSEVLRTIVLGLAVSHPPDLVNVVLIDFKGGATFLGLQKLPHVAAVITNLADDALMVDRMRDALAGELNRRQELLRRAGNLISLTEYERARRVRPELPPLPALLVICDEFTELLVQRPDLTDLFITLGRLGRSLGMHLLLASQRFDDGRMRGLEAHLSYRIVLRTFSAAESRAVLQSSDAAALPSRPGSGYLKPDSGPPIRFQAAYVSGPFRPNSAVAPELGELVPLPFTTGVVRRASADRSVGDTVDSVNLRNSTESARSLMDLLVERLAGQGTLAHSLWLPPLADSPPLDSLCPPLQAEQGLRAGRMDERRLRVPVGLVDRPFDQRHDTLWADFGGSGGHGIVVGGPRSGKSTLLSTMVAALALSHSPTELHVYAVDLGGGALADIAELPHIGDVAGGSEPEKVRRIVAEFAAALRAREFGGTRIRTASRAGPAGGGDGGAEPFADLSGSLRHDPAELFLLIDGWATFRAEFEELESVVLDLVRRGLSCGVHVVLTAGRWADVRPVMKDAMTTRFELRLGDPGESDIDRRAAAGVPPRAPGRGLTPDGLHFITALPRLDGSSNTDDLTDGVAQMVRAHRAAWPGQEAPRVRLLPRLVRAYELPADSDAGSAGHGGTSAVDRRPIVIGLGENALDPVVLDLVEEPHLVVFGDSGCGKTSLLRLLAGRIAARHSPAKARFLVVDYRRTLLGAVPLDHIAGYASSAGAAGGLISDAVTLLQARLPGPDVTVEQLQNRSWWSGADLYVLVDDYELVQAPTGNPVAALTELLPVARDVGLHLVVCRRVGGAARSAYEPVLQRLRDLAASTLIMSGSREEGPLVGSVRPSPLPPGRGVLVTRGEDRQLVQIAFAE